MRQPVSNFSELLNRRRDLVTDLVEGARNSSRRVMGKRTFFPERVSLQNPLVLMPQTLQTRALRRRRRSYEVSALYRARTPCRSGST